MDVERHKNRWVGTLIGLLTFVLMGTATTWAQRSVGEVVDDSVITAKIKSSFAADPQVSALAIDVDTANGVVTLTGIVSTELERQRAIQLTHSTDGDKQVDARNLHLRR